MPMRKRIGSVFFTAAAAAAIIGLSVGPALAATHLTVKVSGGGSYRATAGKTVLTDNGVSVTCTGSKASGKISSGTHRGNAPLKVGTAAKLSFTKCSGPLGSVTTKIKSTPYSVKANSKTSRAGNTDALITGTNVSVSMTGCSFKVTGSSPGYFSNKKHTLNMTSKLPVKEITKGKSAELTVSGVVGCAGLVKNGDHPTFTATYKVSLKHLKITSR
jgi:hypothetical protein